VAADVTSVLIGIAAWKNSAGNQIAPEAGPEKF
jgi:hypothetical protein